MAWWLVRNNLESNKLYELHSERPRQQNLLGAESTSWYWIDGSLIREFDEAQFEEISDIKLEPGDEPLKVKLSLYDEAETRAER